MVKYPKETGIHSGLGKIVGGLFADTVAAYPAFIMLALALVITPLAIVGLLTDDKRRRYFGCLVFVAAVFAAWGVYAAGLSHFTLAGAKGSRNWVFQATVFLGIAAAAWFWALESRERAELLVWNTHAVWRLYRGNWQGVAGLWVIGIFVAMALFAPLLAAHSKLNTLSQVGGTFQPPGSSYYLWMGTDNLGRSILAAFIWSTRISLTVGLMATLMSSIIGSLVGVVAGYVSGWVSEVLMRVTDVFLVIPWLPLAMVLAKMFEGSYWLIVIIIGATSWPSTARVVRADTLRVAEQQFIERARAIGSKKFHILSRHVLPNVMPIVFANTVLVAAVAILSETMLSFLGLGDTANSSWGSMLRDVWNFNARTLWWWVLPPGLAIVFVLAAINFVGQAFDEVLDPKLRKREDRDTTRPAVVVLATGVTPDVAGHDSEPDANNDDPGGLR